MEEILIDCMEADDDHSSTPPLNRSANNNHGHSPQSTRNGGHINPSINRIDDEKRVVHETEFIHKSNKKGDKADNWRRDQAVPPNRPRVDSNAMASVIMMYSPDIPSAAHGYDQRSKLANYYSTIEAEETVKCIVSTVILVFIMVAMLLVVFVLNPQM